MPHPRDATVASLGYIPPRPSLCRILGGPATPAATAATAWRNESGKSWRKKEQKERSGGTCAQPPWASERVYRVGYSLPLGAALFFPFFRFPFPVFPAQSSPSQPMPCHCNPFHTIFADRKPRPVHVEASATTRWIQQLLDTSEKVEWKEPR